MSIFKYEGALVIFILDEKSSADSGLLMTEKKSYEPPADIINNIETDYDLPKEENPVSRIQDDETIVRNEQDSLLYSTQNEIEGYDPEAEGTAIKIEEVEEESGKQKEEELKIKYDGKYNPRKKRTEYGIKFIEPNKEEDYTPQEIKAMKNEAENNIVNVSREIEKELEVITEETENSDTEKKKED